MAWSEAVSAAWTMESERCSPSNRRWAEPEEVALEAGMGTTSVAKLSPWPRRFELHLSEEYRSVAALQIQMDPTSQR